jgi:hypothetical protein
MLELMLILQFILTSFLYQNCFLAIPLLFLEGDDSFHSDTIGFLAQMLFTLDGTLPCIIMLELLLILNFILTSFLYQNDFLTVPLLLRASDNLFRSDAAWVFGPQVVYAAGMLPCIIMLELLLILKFILTSFLYQNAFLVVPLLLHASDNSFRSDAIWFLAQMLFMLDGTLPCIIMLQLLLILKFILMSF